MSVDLDKTIDATAAVVKIIGDTATAVMQVGDVVLPILQDVGLLFPPAAVAANYVSVALPYITKVAQYAPAVSKGLESNKTMIEAAIGVGSALLSPLSDLMTAIPELAAVHTFFADLDAFLKANEFSPEDPRFDRESASNA
ncbi:MAG: hypothetical protein KGL39_31340 [Patescibacteria group bacterium]|nr:hypothetical protein [Patescibacteria group bacterium]